MEFSIISPEFWPIYVVWVVATVRYIRRCRNETLLRERFGRLQDEHDRHRAHVRDKLENGWES